MSSRRALVLIDASAVVDPWEPDGGNLDDLADFAYAARTWDVPVVFYRPPESEVSMFARWAFDRLAYLGCEIVDEPISGRARMTWWLHGVTDRDVPIARADRVRDVAVEIGEPPPLEPLLDEVRRYVAAMTMRADG